MRKLPLLLLTFLFILELQGQHWLAGIDTLELLEKKQVNIYPDYIELPFELSNGSIILEADLWGRKDHFILDTGAPALIINSSYRNGFNARKGFSATGAINIFDIHVNNFNLGGLNIQAANAMALDISHIERIKKQPIGGFIGFNVIRDYEMMIDYETEILKLFKPNSTEYHHSIPPRKVIPITMQSHFPVIRVKIGKRTFHFALDTGAEVNILCEKSRKKVKPEHILQLDNTAFVSFNKDTKNTDRITVDQVKVKGEFFKELDFTIGDLSAINQAESIDIDGLLGFPFLSSRKFSINYKESKLYIWDKEDMFIPSEGEDLQLLTKQERP